MGFKTFPVFEITLSIIIIICSLLSINQNVFICNQNVIFFTDLQLIIINVQLTMLARGSEVHKVNIIARNLRELKLFGIMYIKYNG
jgi:hypothetical protein